MRAASPGRRGPTRWTGRARPRRGAGRPRTRRPAWRPSGSLRSASRPCPCPSSSPRSSRRGNQTPALNVKATGLDSVAPTVTCCVCVPSFSCHASIVYVPAGRSLIAYVPSAAVTAKNGCETTPQYADIQPCTSHLMWIMTSGLSNFFVYFIPLTGMPRLKDSFFSGREWMLWRVSSLFRMSRLCPATMPKTCGWYVQPLWSMTAAAAGGGYVPEIPDFTYTNTFARPLSGPTTISSFATSPGCAFAQKASADILNFSGAGTAPSKTILPVTAAAPMAPAAGPAAEAAEAAGAAAPSVAAPLARADLGLSSSSSLPPQPAASTAASAVTAQTQTKRKRIAGPDMRASSRSISLSCAPGTRAIDDRQSPDARRIRGAPARRDAAQVPVPHVLRGDEREEVPPPRASRRRPFRMG